MRFSAKVNKTKRTFLQCSATPLCLLVWSCRVNVSRALNVCRSLTEHRGPQCSIKEPLQRRQTSVEFFSRARDSAREGGVKGSQSCLSLFHTNQIACEELLSTFFLLFVFNPQLKSLPFFMKRSCLHLSCISSANV